MASATRVETPTSGGAPALGQGAGGGDTVAQTGEPPGPTPTAIRSRSSRSDAGLGERLLDEAEQPRRRGRALARRRVVARLERAAAGAQTAAAVAAVEVSRPRIMRSSPRVAAGVLEPHAVRDRSSGQAPGARSGHSTKAIASGAKNGSSRPGSSAPMPPSR